MLKKNFLLKKLFLILLFVFSFIIAYAADPEAEKHNEQGIKYLEQKQYDLAIKEFNISIQLDPNYAEAIKNRGNVYYAQGKLEPALKDYLLSISVNPKYWNAYNNAGNVYWDMKKYDDALLYYDKAVKLNPPKGKPYYNAGSTCSSLGKYEKAIEYLNKGLTVDSDSAEIHAELGYAFYQIKKVKEAIEHLKAAIKYDPNYSVSYFSLGRIYEDEAIKLNARYIKSSADDPNSAADRDAAYNRFYDALGNYLKAVEIEPENYKYRFCVGNVYFGLIEDDKALDEYRIAIDYARAQGDNDMIKRIQAQIKLIQDLKEKREKEEGGKQK